MPEQKVHRWVKALLNVLVGYVVISVAKVVLLVKDRNDCSHCEFVVLVVSGRSGNVSRNVAQRWSS